MYSSIEKKMHYCDVDGCGKPSGTYLKCKHHRALIYMERSRKKREVKGITSSKDEKFYQYIWKVKPHFCGECDTELHLPEKGDCRDMAHHILPKKPYPYFRYDERNIILLCGRFGCHGKAESAISYPKMKVFEYCEGIKKHLLESVGLTYESKITI